MLTKKSALSYAKFNIRVNSIQPSAIATEMSGIPWDDLENSTVISSRKELQPLHRMGHPYDVAYAALFFASDESAFVTGATLLVDGGASVKYWLSGNELPIAYGIKSVVIVTMALVVCLLLNLGSIMLGLP